MEQIYAELLAMKAAGRNVNTQSQQRLSNGMKVGLWLARNRDKLTEEQLRALS